MIETDLRRLIENGVEEGKTIEYKRDLPGTTDSEKKEFLADLSSFANTAGGWLYYGIREENRLPVELVGAENSNEDEAIQRLENLARDGIQPRLPSFHIIPVRLASSKTILAIEIPRSWALPHRVTLKGDDKFYCRNSGGKYPVDVTELRHLFAQSESLADRMRRFRQDRLAIIQSGESPLTRSATAKVVLHLISVQAFEPGVAFDLSGIDTRWQSLGPLFAPVWNFRHNFDGALTYSVEHSTGATLSYLQLFRTGIIEAGDTHLLGAGRGSKYIPGAAFEEKLALTVGPYLDRLRELGVQPPVYLGLSLLSVLGYRMAVSPGFDGPQNNTIDREDLVVPEIRIDDFSADFLKILRPVFDVVWNAAGWPGSIYYGSDGKRRKSD